MCPKPTPTRLEVMIPNPTSNLSLLNTGRDGRAQLLKASWDKAFLINELSQQKNLLGWHLVLLHVCLQEWLGTLKALLCIWWFDCVWPSSYFKTQRQTLLLRNVRYQLVQLPSELNKICARWMQQRWDGRGDRGRQGMATAGCFWRVSGLLPVPPSTTSTFSSVLCRTTIELQQQQQD